MSDILQKNLSKWQPYAVLFIRITFGFHLLIYNYESIFSLSAGDDSGPFLTKLGIPFPYLMAWLYMGTEFLGGLAMIIGFKMRWFALLLIIVFLVALLTAHRGSPYSQTFDALHMLAVSCFFLLYGSGKVSVDEWLEQRKG